METTKEIQEVKLEVGVKAFILGPDSKYLILKRSKPYPGLTEPMWDIPGGRINPSEPLLTALGREIKEETGMKMSPKPTLFFAQDILRVPGKHTVRLTYTARADGEIKLDSIEHTEYRWATLDELAQLYHDKFLDDPLEQLRLNKS